MVRLAIKSNPNFSLNLSEADTKKHSYTYQTMRHFNEIYPNDEFYFILGADSLFAFEEWKDFRKIFTTCTILAAMRDDKDASAMKGQIRYLTEAYGGQQRGSACVIWCLMLSRITSKKRNYIFKAYFICTCQNGGEQ